MDNPSTPPASEQPVAEQDKTSMGIKSNVAALLSYVLGFITGLIFFLIEKENKYVRFHAMQSIILFGAFFVLNMAIGFTASIFFSIMGGFTHGYSGFTGYDLISGIQGIISLVAPVLWIVLMIKAYQGEKFKLPVIGDIAEKNA